MSYRWVHQCSPHHKYVLYLWYSGSISTCIWWLSILCPGFWLFGSSITVLRPAKISVKRPGMRIITGDQSWVYSYDLTELQPSQWKRSQSPWLGALGQECKSIHVAVFDIHKVVHSKFDPLGQNIPHKIPTLRLMAIGVSKMTMCPHVENIHISCSKFHCPLS